MLSAFQMAFMISVRFQLRVAEILIMLVLLIVSAISTWWLGVKLHRRIRRSLGRDVENESELTSLNTWMKVEDAEERDQTSKSL